MRYVFDQVAADIALIYGVSFLVLGALAAIMPRQNATFLFARDLWLVSAFGLLHGTLALLVEKNIGVFTPYEVPPLAAAVWLAASYLPLLEFGRRQVHAAALSSHSQRAAWFQAPVVLGAALGLVAALALWTGTAAGLEAGARYFIGFPGALLSGIGLPLRHPAAVSKTSPGAIRIQFWILTLAAAAYSVLIPAMTAGHESLPGWLPTGWHLAAIGIPLAVPRALVALLQIVGLLSLSRVTHFAVRTIEAGWSESELRLAKAQQIAKIGSWELDLRSNVLHWSDEIFHIFEVDKTRFGASYEAFLAAIHPEDRDAVNTAYTRSLRTHEPYEITHRLRMPDGRIKYVQEHCDTEFDAAGTPLRSLGTVQDITARVAAESALRESEARYRRIIENSNEGIFTVDAERRITFVNPRMAEMLGYPPGQVIGRRIGEFIPPSEHADSQERLRRRRRGIAERYERNYVRSDGTQITVQISSVPMFDDARAFAGSTNMAVEITERKRLEQQFLQAQKMEAVGRLAGGVAHDFNNLLTVILGYAALLKVRIPPADPLRSHVEQIEKAGDRSRELTQRLLVFSRHQVLQLQTTTLNDIVSGMEPMLRRVVGEDIDLTVTPDPTPGSVRVDVGQMEQVIMNLVVNARDAMPNGGRLAIEVSREALDAGYVLEHPGLRPGMYQRIVVTDSGEGMPKAVMAHLFEPFFTTKPPGKGTGLGLSTVYGIVRNCGGHVWVYSEEGHGTSFKIYLPEAGGGEATAAPAHLAVTTGGSETILLAEDDDAVRELVRLILTESGYRVLPARDAAHALELCKAYQGPIHLLLTDVVMPHGGGLELAGQVRARIPGIPVVFMSGYTGETAASAGLLPSDARFVQKPILPDALRSQIRQALDS